jgi:enoyl-CoA hydratase/carnithine racemase
LLEPLVGRVPGLAAQAATVLVLAVHFFSAAPSAKYMIPKSSVENTTGTLELRALLPFVAVVNPLVVNLAIVPLVTA